MKKVAFTAIVLLFLTLSLASNVQAQETNEELDRTPEAAPAEVVITTPGAAFKNGSADGQCTTAGASCTTSGKAPGTCVDNGKGSGVCAPVNRTTDPLFDTGCKPDEICNIAPEKISRDLQGGQSDNKRWTSNPLGAIRDYYEEWFGDVKPDSLYHYGTDLLTKFGFQVQDASFNDLTPAQIQNVTLHDYQPKRFCTTSRICLSNQWSDDPKFYQFLTTQTWCTEDPPGRKELIEGTRRLACALTGYVCSPDFQLPDTRVKKLAALTCGTPMDEGKHMDLNTLEFIKKNNYGENAVTHWIVNLVTELITGPETVEVSDGVFKEFWYSHIPSTAREKGSSANSMAASLAGVSFTVTKEDLKPFAYPVTEEGKDALTKVGGVWNTYKNDAFDDKFNTPFPDAIYDTQRWDVNVKGFHPTEAPTLQSMNARQESAQCFGNCSITNAALQNKVLANCKCDQNWVGASKVQAAPIAADTPIPQADPESRLVANVSVPSASAIAPNFAKHPSGSGIQKAIENAATKGQIPACVLEAVAMIEGGYTGDYTCKPDSCGAVGPFQISVGVCNGCKASACPNVLPKTMTAADMCNTDKSASVAVNVLKGKAKYFGLPLSNADPKTQKQAIIIAGDSYNGTTKPLSRLKSTTNQTLSYGEWVYAHCDPTYTTHVDHQFPK